MRRQQGCSGSHAIARMHVEAAFTKLRILLFLALHLMLVHSDRVRVVWGKQRRSVTVSNRWQRKDMASVCSRVYK
jgi:hypothetical protein